MGLLGEQCTLVISALVKLLLTWAMSFGIPIGRLSEVMVCEVVDKTYEIPYLTGDSRGGAEMINDAE